MSGVVKAGASGYGIRLNHRQNSDLAGYEPPEAPVSKSASLGHRRRSREGRLDSAMAARDDTLPADGDMRMATWTCRMKSSDCELG